MTERKWMIYKRRPNKTSPALIELTVLVENTSVTVFLTKAEALRLASEITLATIGDDV